MIDSIQCPHCGPNCLNGAAHNARVEDGVIYSVARCKHFWSLWCRYLNNPFEERECLWCKEQETRKVSIPSVSPASTKEEK